MDEDLNDRTEYTELFSTETFPLDDIDPNGLKISSVPHERRMQGSSFINKSEIVTIPDLIPIGECRRDELENLLFKKIKLCKIMFDFNDPYSQIYQKEIKRQTLQELHEFFAEPPINIHTDRLYAALIKMIVTNIFRALPIFNDIDLMTEDQESYYEKAWPHLSIVYEIFYAWISTSEFNSEIAERHIDSNFISAYIDLFDTKDSRERSILLDILYVLYIKFFDARTNIRHCISYIFYAQIYEGLNFSGIKELLDLLNSIIQGFNVPLKKEHVLLLERSILPLHLDSFMHNYHKELKKCVRYFIEKDNKLSSLVITYFIKKFPKSPNINRILIMDEMEAIFKIIKYEIIHETIDPLLNFLIKIMGDDHFQSAERALFLSKFLYVAFDNKFKEKVRNAHLQPLYSICHNHWSEHIRTCSKTLYNIYLTID